MLRFSVASQLRQYVLQTDPLVNLRLLSLFLQHVPGTRKSAALLPDEKERLRRLMWETACSQFEDAKAFLVWRTQVGAFGLGRSLPLNVPNNKFS
jgi:hypothetical protein